MKRYHRLSEESTSSDEDVSNSKPVPPDKRRQSERLRTPQGKTRAPEPPASTPRTPVRRADRPQPRTSHDDSLMQIISDDMTEIARSFTPSAPPLSTPSSSADSDIEQYTPSPQAKNRVRARVLADRLEVSDKGVWGQKGLEILASWASLTDTWEVENIQEKLDQVYRDADSTVTREVQRLYEKVEKGESLTQAERNYLNINSGFYHARLMEKHQRNKQSNMTLTNLRNAEVCMVTPDSTVQGYCTSCEVCHTVNDTSNVCSQWDKHGPRCVPEMLLNQEYLVQQHDAVIVGSNHLLFLPISLQNRVLNLGTTSKPKYQPFNRGTNLLNLGHDSLIAKLKERISLLSKNKVEPIWVEYTRSDHSVDWWLNLWGFFMAIEYLRETYQGVIGVVIPPFAAQTQEEQDSYEKLKVQRNVVSLVARLTGLLLGTPVWSLDMQGARRESGWYTSYPHFYRESIYNSHMERTREYHRRLEEEFRGVLGAYGTVKY